MTCVICAGQSRHIFSGRIMEKYDIKYFHCTMCGFLRTEKPFWLEEAYRDPINVSDTGILSRNISYSRAVAAVIFFLFDRHARYLDYAGGYGILTRLMRDYGFDFFWHDRYARNIFAGGFEFTPGSGEINLLTAFEVFEHFWDPVPEVERMLGITRNVLFSTELLPTRIPGPEEWWYFGLDHGQHVGFHTCESLRRLAVRNNLRFYSNGRNLHLFTEKKIPETLFIAIVKFAPLGLGKAIKLFLNSRTESDLRLLVRPGDSGGEGEEVR